MEPTRGILLVLKTPRASQAYNYTPGVDQFGGKGERDSKHPDTLSSIGYGLAGHGSYISSGNALNLSC